MIQISQYVKEAFAMLEKVNAKMVQEHRTLMNHDLTPKQFLMLQTIRDAKKITVNQLADKLSLSPSSVSQLISRLENRNFLRRELNKENRREVLVMLGEEGSKLFEEYSKIDNIIIHNYYSEFTIEEVLQFRNLVYKLHSVMESKESIQKDYTREEE